MKPPQITAEDVKIYRDSSASRISASGRQRQSLVSQEGLTRLQEEYREKMLIREFEKHVAEQERVERELQQYPFMPTLISRQRSGSIDQNQRNLMQSNSSKRVLS